MAVVGKRSVSRLELVRTGEGRQCNRRWVLSSRLRLDASEWRAEPSWTDRSRSVDPPGVDRRKGRATWLPSRSNSEMDRSREAGQNRR